MANPSEEELKETNIGRILNKIAKSGNVEAQNIVSNWRRKCR